MMLRLFTIGLLALTNISSVIFANDEATSACKSALEQPAFKVQSKFQITDLSIIPTNILTAIQEGTYHPQIQRRGFVVQEYLLVNDDNLREVINKINDATIPFGTEEQQKAFLEEPGAAKEIRLMSKSIKIGERRAEIYQATIKGDRELTVRLLETPENLSAEMMQTLKSLFETLRPRVTAKARKAYFEFTPTDTTGQVLRRPNGTELSVAVDIFMAGNRHNPRPIAINGEIDFQGESRDAAIASAQTWLRETDGKPGFLGRDLIEVLGTKSRDYAIYGVPGFITETIAPFTSGNSAILDRILAEYQTWAHPTIVDLALSEPDKPQKSQELSFFRFIYNFFHVGGNIHKAMERLEKVYGGTDFEVLVPYLEKRIHVLQNRESVAGGLKIKSSLVYVNRNFDLTHGHFNSINSVDTSDPLWEDLHFGLLDIFNNKKITPIMERHKEILIGKGRYNLNETLEEYFLKVWSEYMFGSTVNTAEFTKMRHQLVETLGKAFHSNPLNRIPGLGRATSYANYLRYRKQWKEVDAALNRLLTASIEQKEGAFYEIYERLRPKYDNAFQITLDNAFLGTLVYDFIYIIMMDATAHIAKFSDLDRKQQVQRSIHDGFLYPFRFRVAEEDGGNIKKGDFYLVNLQRSGLFFSYGARFCPGAKLFKEITKAYLEILAPFDITMINAACPLETTGNPDTPFMTTEVDVDMAPRTCPMARFRNGAAR